MLALLIVIEALIVVSMLVIVIDNWVVKRKRNKQVTKLIKTKHKE